MASYPNDDDELEQFMLLYAQTSLLASAEGPRGLERKREDNEDRLSDGPADEEVRHASLLRAWQELLSPCLSHVIPNVLPVVVLGL